MDRGFLSNVELRNPSGRFIYSLALLFLILVAAVTVFPFIFAFTSGLKSSTEVINTLNLLPQNPQWENYTRAWTLFDMTRMFGNSFVIVGGSVLFRVLVSAA